MLEQGHSVAEAPAAAIRKRSRLFGVLALLLSVVVFVFGVAPEFTGGAAGWTPTACVVLESYVESRQDTEPWGNSMRLFTVYLPYVRYTYSFGGAEYESDVVSLQASDSARDPARAQRIVDTYPPGTSQTCYVDPDAPHQAVLHQRSSTAPWLFAAGGTLLAVFGIAGLLLPSRATRSIAH